MTFLILHLILFSISCQATSSLSTTSSSPSTCPSRTVNYITHSLPQQCLTSARNPSQNNSTTSHESVVKSFSNVTGEVALPVHLTNGLSTGNQSVATSTSASTEDALHESTTSSAQSVASIAIPEPNISNEDDADLSGGNFLSFEEWKKQNLKKAGQSEHIGNRQQIESLERRHRPDNSLESLGEDGEIDIDFTGFVPDGPQVPLKEKIEAIDRSSQGSEPSGDETAIRPRVSPRSKDAGTTCKERFNYASFDCAANVLKTNKEAKSPNTVLVENKDSYMLNQCSAKNKFIILELCADILVDTVVLANFEFFSSTFRTFSVSVSDRYPVKADKWKVLGQFEARNTRQVQAFLVEQPLIWARYLRIEFHTHYGTEFYCPLSLVRIHGTNMMDDYRHDLDQAMGEEEEIETGQVILNTADPVTNEATSIQQTAAAVGPESTPMVEEEKAIEATEMIDLEEDKFAAQDSSTLEKQDETSALEIDLLPSASVSAMEAIRSVVESTETCSPAESPSESETVLASPISTTDEVNTSHTITHMSSTSTSSLHAATKSETGESAAKSDNSTDASSIKKSAFDRNRTPSTNASIKTTAQTVSASNEAVKKAVNTTIHAMNSTANITTSRTKLPSATQSQPAIPSTQDSFFKSVQKRLQMLEANSSMSLQYIEDQSRALRDAFKKVEQRQLARTNTFLDQLNNTVLSELREFRQQYDQLWQSTVIELEMQRERYEKDNEAINLRIGVLADEVIFQRRLAILQMILIMICLMLVLFSRGTINNYLELPIVQNMLARSPSSKWLNLSTEGLIRPSPIRTRSAQQLRNERTTSKVHRRMESEDSNTDTMSGNGIYAPPTPVSDYSPSDALEDGRSPISGSDVDESKFDDLEFDPGMIERPVSSPPTLTLNNDLLAPDSGVSEDDERLEKVLPFVNDSASSTSSPLLSARQSSSVKRLSWNIPES